MGMVSLATRSFYDQGYCSLYSLDRPQSRSGLATIQTLLFERDSLTDQQRWKGLNVSVLILVPVLKMSVRWTTKIRVLPLEVNSLSSTPDWVCFVIMLTRCYLTAVYSVVFKLMWLFAVVVHVTCPSFFMCCDIKSRSRYRGIYKSGTLNSTLSESHDGVLLRQVWLVFCALRSSALYVYTYSTVSKTGCSRLPL
jgi:hypothetical protein